MAGFEIATKIKICVLGETVGKSSLVNAFVKNNFSGKQIEHENMEEIHHKQMEMLNQRFHLEITDTTNNNEVDSTYDDILKIEWKGMDGYSLDIREKWIMNSDVLFLCFNRVNRISWMILQSLHQVTTQYLSKQNISNVQIYIISTCSDLYLSQTSLANLDSIDLVSFKETLEYISKFDNVFQYETSSKMYHNIDTVFKDAITKYNELHPHKKKIKKKKRKRKKSMSQTLKRKTSVAIKSVASPLPAPAHVQTVPMSPNNKNIYNAEPTDIQLQNDGIYQMKQSKLSNDNVSRSVSQKQQKSEQIIVESTNILKSTATEKTIINDNVAQYLEKKKTEDKSVAIEEPQQKAKQEEHQEEQQEEDEEETLRQDAKAKVVVEEDKDDDEKLMDDEETKANIYQHNGINGYGCRYESPLSSLSSQEIYNIEYSSKYKESMEFKNIQKTFDTYHQIKVFYEQNQPFEQGTDQYIEYKTSTLLFFKDLDATLTTIGCMENDKKMFFIQCRQHIIFKMIKSINVCKDQYEYLEKITLLTGPCPLMVTRLNENNDYWSILSDASFVSKISIDYDEWMANKKSENEFKNELSGALHINPIYIKINGVGKGLNDIVIDWTVMYIWIPYYIQGVEGNLIYRQHTIKPQDQIEVQYKKDWIPCTILQVKDTLNKKGKQIKVRYNKVDGIDRFMTTNTEWLWTIKEYERLRLPDKVYVMVLYNGIQISTTYKPPSLANCRDGNMDLLDIGHHIFVNRDNIWYRCEVIDVMEGKEILILYLVNTFVINTEWLRLWQPSDQQRISFQDMRM